MPTLLDPNSSGRSPYVSDDFGYKYPANLNLKPDSPDHRTLVTEVFTRAQESSNEMSKRYESWKKVDETLTAYIKLDEAEEVIKNNDSRKPLSIVVPYSYATLETILTYFVNAFLESPIFRYEGHAPEDIVGAILLEKVIDQHVNNFKVALNLHTMFRDSLAYGIGVVTPTWDRKWGWKTVERNQGFMSALFSRFIDLGKMKEQQEVILFEGNRLKNVDPFKYLPDPNVSIHEVQNGEFVGWVEETNYMKLLELEKNDKDVFNVKYLKGLGTGGRSQFNKAKSDSGRSSKYGTSTGTAGIMSTSPIDVVWMYWNLIPKDRKLGANEYPEKWLIGLAADKYIICAKPMKLNHNMYPVAVCAPDFDGYSATPVSRLELMYGMQTALDWLFNSHIANVRKAINDMLIVDPSLINMADLQDPRPGKLIRMRRAAWGRGVKDAVMQLPVTDITKQHIPDASYIVDLMQRTSAATDSLSGMVRQGGERVTATETRDTRSSALSRLTKAARIASLQAMQDIGYMFATHTQQLMDRDLYVTATGEWSEVLKKEYSQGIAGGRIHVTPYDLLIDYDVMIKDGSVQGSEYNEAWVEIFRILSAQPMFFQNFDMVRIFKHIARIMGAKDINEFIIDAGAVPNVEASIDTTQNIEKGVQQGNMVPVEQYPTGR